MLNLINFQYREWVRATLHILCRTLQTSRQSRASLLLLHHHHLRSMLFVIAAVSTMDRQFSRYIHAFSLSFIPFICKCMCRVHSVSYLTRAKSLGLVLKIKVLVSVFCVEEKKVLFTQLGILTYGTL